MERIRAPKHGTFAKLDSLRHGILGMKRHLLCPKLSPMSTCLNAQPMLGLGPEVLPREKRVDGSLECLRTESLDLIEASPFLAHP